MGVSTIFWFLPNTPTLAPVTVFYSVFVDVFFFFLQFSTLAIVVKVDEKQTAYVNEENSFTHTATHLKKQTHTNAYTSGICVKPQVNLLYTPHIV